MFNFYLIKVWDSEENKWCPSWFYPFRTPMIPRLICFMDQKDIDELNTKNNILARIKAQSMISCL